MIREGQPGEIDTHAESMKRNKSSRVLCSGYPVIQGEMGGWDESLEEEEERGGMVQANVGQKLEICYILRVFFGDRFLYFTLLLAVAMLNRNQLLIC